LTHPTGEQHCLFKPTSTGDLSNIIAEKYSKILIVIKFDLNQIKYSRKIFKYLAEKYSKI